MEHKSIRTSIIPPGDEGGGSLQNKIACIPEFISLLDQLNMRSHITINGCFHKSQLACHQVKKFWIRIYFLNSKLRL